MASHRVISSIERPEPALVERFRAINFGYVAQELDRSQMMATDIRPLLNQNFSFVGPAVTVALEELDSLMSVAALGVALPGDVIVVAAQGRSDTSVWGGGLTLSAQNLGCVGVVVDGLVQNTSSILSRGLPVFCRGSHPGHGTMQHPGSVNVPVSCGGVVVYPGDLVFANLDGVLVLPRGQAAATIDVVEKNTARLAESAGWMESTGKTMLDQRGGQSFIEAAGVTWE